MTLSSRQIALKHATAFRDALSGGPTSFEDAIEVAITEALSQDAALDDPRLFVSVDFHRSVVEPLQAQLAGIKAALNCDALHQDPETVARALYDALMDSNSLLKRMETMSERPPGIPDQIAINRKWLCLPAAAPHDPTLGVDGSRGGQRP